MNTKVVAIEENVLSIYTASLEAKMNALLKSEDYTQLKVNQTQDVRNNRTVYRAVIIAHNGEVE